MFFVVLSIILVAFGHNSLLGIGAAAIGYACFWNVALQKFTNTRDRFWAFFVWYAICLSVQLSWLTSTRYMGSGILVIYVLVVIVFALQFGSLAFFFNTKNLSFRRCLAIAGFWVILEWSRLTYIPGNWIPVGMALSTTSYAIQFAALFGAYGLSFWVMFVNSYALCAKNRIVWTSLAAFPYLFGCVQQTWVHWFVREEQTLSIALVQTGIRPEQKDRMHGHAGSYIPPISQWERIWEQLDQEKKVDLIILPEASIGLGAHHPCYPIEMVEILWQYHFGKQALLDLPPQKGKTVSNSYLAQSLANHFNADVILGFVDGRYNSAFCFHPGDLPSEKTEKRFLVPLGEYVPFSENQWVAHFFSEQFGVTDAFDVGTESKIFSSHCPIAASICVEETYGQFMRDLRNQGARLFVNVTNDIWFPASRLPEHHFQLGKMRSAENGVYSLRSCNTGVTGVIDCCGRVVETIPVSEEKVDVLYTSIPIKSFQTLYSFWGDGAILSFSALCLIFGIYRRRK
ncbi:MAG TPA: apolipoprotein N-acyltransferase [Chlamydiales bacterium]|nr:apolipoprotein N-acyltransferase [Chlamydiales bacterium]